MSKRQPIRVFEGTLGPHEPFWRIRNAVESESGEPEIELYGFISEWAWFDDDVTPKKFKTDLYALGGGPVTLRINSGGGEIFAASVIRSIIVDYPERVTARIDGLAASAASWVALAADVVCMQDTAFLMIHDPSAIALGTIADIKAVLDSLKVLKAGIVDAYIAKTKLPAERLAKMMTDETWMSAGQAKELGFIDQVISAPGKKTPVASNAAYVNALRMYTNVPAALLVQPVQEPDEQVDDDHDPAALERQQATDRLRAMVKVLR